MLQVKAEVWRRNDQEVGKIRKDDNDFNKGEERDEYDKMRFKSETMVGLRIKNMVKKFEKSVDYKDEGSKILPTNQLNDQLSFLDNLDINNLKNSIQEDINSNL